MSEEKEKRPYYNAGRQKRAKKPKEKRPVGRPKGTKNPVGRPKGSKTELTPEQKEFRKNLPTEYKLLSDKEILVIHSLVDNELRQLTVSERMKRIGVSRGFYYSVLNKQNTKQIINNYCISLIGEKQIDVVNALVNFAIDGKNNFQDRRTLLSMTGLYTGDKQAVNVNIDNSNQEVKNPYAGLSREQLEVLISNMNNDKIENDVIDVANYEEVEE